MIIQKIDMEKLVVLDYSNNSISIYNIDKNNEMSTDDLLIFYHHDPNDCAVLYTSDLTIYV